MTEFSKKSIIKEIAKFTIQENFLLLCLLLIHILISTKLTQFLIIISSLNFKILTQMFANHISEIILELITIPLVNNIMKNIKSKLIESKNIDQEESIYAKILKSQTIKLIIKSGLNLIYSGMLFFLLFQYNSKLIIFIGIYIIILVFSQKYIIIKRREAWNTTSDTYKDISQTLNEIELIKQDLFSANIQSIEKEKQTWIIWGYSLNFIKLLLISIICSYIYYDPSATIILYQLWLLTAKILTISGYLDDFIQSLKLTSKIENSSKHNSNILILNYVQIFHLGPFNLKEDSSCIILTADNGTGKTLIAKAIANLIPYKGEIITPKSFYLGLDSQNVKNTKTSKGESIIKLINLALTKDYELFILDEVLDILSNENQNLILNKLTNKRLFIITHKKIDVKREIKQYTINNKQLIDINTARN